MLAGARCWSCGCFVTTRPGAALPFSVQFDPFWARIKKRGHGCDSRRHSGNGRGYADDRFSSVGMGGGAGPSLKGFAIERAAQDFLIRGLREAVRGFPNLRMASVENGSDFLGSMFYKFDQTAKKSYWWFDDHPADTSQHVWMNSFWEDDVDEVVELMARIVIFGSDWPHIEGMPQPLDYLVELKNLDDAQIKQVMLDNVTFLNTPRPC